MKSLFLKQFRAWLTSTAIRILQKLISGDIQPGGRHLDDLLGSFTPTFTVGTECSNNWYLYKRWLQLVVANHIHRELSACQIGEDVIIPQGNLRHRWYCFHFPQRTLTSWQSRPPLSFSPAPHLQPCPVIVSDLVVQLYIAGDLLNVTLDAERPKSHQRPPTEKPRLYCSGLLLHQQRNSTLWHHGSYSITLRALSIIVNAK